MDGHTITLLAGKKMSKRQEALRHGRPVVYLTITCTTLLLFAIVLSLSRSSSLLFLSLVQSSSLGSPFNDDHALIYLDPSSLETTTNTSLSSRPPSSALSSTFVLNQMRVHVVYFGHLFKDLWRDLISLQLAELEEFGLAEFATSIHVVLTRTHSDDVVDWAVLNQGKDLVLKTIPNAKVYLYNKNTFEYHGIRQVWSLAHSLANSSNLGADVILYFHTKSMVNNRPGEAQARSEMNLKLTNAVIKPWRSIIHRFSIDPSIDRAGYVVAGHGWVWYNFFWARASYLRRLVRPLENPNRLYYEGWLGKIDIGVNQMYNGEQVFEVADVKGALTLCPKLNSNWTLGVWVGYRPFENRSLDDCR